jgi:hypothetical protein
MYKKDLVEREKQVKKMMVKQATMGMRAQCIKAEQNNIDEIDPSLLDAQTDLTFMCRHSNDM